MIPGLVAAARDVAVAYHDPQSKADGVQGSNRQADRSTGSCQLCSKGRASMICEICGDPSF